MIDKHGAFIGLVNAPLGKEKATKEKINTTFEDYIKVLNRFREKYIDENSNLFRPTFYALLGCYDLAVIAKVDDFVFGYQKFNPNISFGEQDINDAEDKKVRSFNYHIYNCTLSAKDTTYKYGYDDLFPKKESESTSTLSTPSFCTITSFKIKNSLLIGSGVEIIEAIKKGIARRINHYNATPDLHVDKKVRYLILDTTSWHEITVLILGDCLSILGNILYRIRESISIEDIEDILNPNKESIEKDKSISDDENIVKKSLYYNWLEDEDKKNYQNTNVFSASNTYFGIDYDKLDEKSNETFNAWVANSITKHNGNVDAFARITTIPTAHTNSPDGKIGDFEMGYVLYNDADIEPGSYKSGSHTNGAVTVENTLGKMVRYYRDNLLAKDANATVRNGIRRTNTTPKIREDVDIKTIFSGSNESIVRTNIAKKLDEKLQFNANEVDEVWHNMTSLRVSKAVRQRVLKVLSNYNDIISDRQLYIYIIGVHPFIMAMIGYLKDEADKQKKPLHAATDAHRLMNKINGFARLFERVHFNIMQHSLRTMDLSEFNLDFNGGIQQNSTVANFVFGLFRSTLGFYESDFAYLKWKPVFHSPSVAYLSNTSGIKSYEYSLQLNYFHITEPATFLVTIFKESFNMFFEKTRHTVIERAEDVCDYLLAWKSEEIVKIKKDYYQTHTLDSKQKIELDFGMLYYLFKEYPQRGSLHLQQELLGEIQKSKISENLDVLVQTYQYLKFIDDELIQYVLVDYSNFLFYFNKDIGLYSDWYWIHFFQEPDVYTTNGKISHIMFLKAIFRITMVYILVADNGTTCDYENLFANMGEQMWYRKLKEFKPELYELHHESAFAICRLLHENSFLSGFLNMKDIKEYAQSLTPNVVQTDDVFRYSENCYKLFSKILINGKCDSTLYSEILSSKSYLNVGRHKRLVGDKSVLFGFVSGAFMGYLKALLEYVDVPIFRNRIDEDKSGQINASSIKSDKIQPDPNGGFFVNGQLKQYYFHANNILFKMLYNHTLVCKIEYFYHIQNWKEKNQ